MAVRECVYICIICIIVPGHQQLASPSQTLYPSLNMWTINTDTLMMMMIDLPIHPPCCVVVTPSNQDNGVSCLWNPACILPTVF